MLDTSLNQNLLHYLWEGVNYGIAIVEGYEQNFCYIACNSKFAIDIDPDYYSKCLHSGQPLTFQQGSWQIIINPLQGNQLLVTTIELLDHGQIKAALVESEINFRSLVEDAHDFIVIWDLDGIMTYLSPSFEAFFGHRASDWLGKAFFPLAHPEDLAACIAANQQVATTGKTLLGFEFRALHQDKYYFWASANIVPIRDKTGSVIAFQGILRNIDALKQQEAALKEYADRQALLNRLTNQIRNSLDVDSILKTTIQELYHLLQVDWCAFSWYDPTTQPATWHVVADQYCGEMSWIGIYSADVIGAIDQNILQLEILQIDQAELYEEESHRAFLLESGVQSRLCIPIKTQREQIGIIICDHQQQQHDWTESEVNLVQAVADQLAIAIDQAELYAQSRAKSEKLKVTLQELQQTQTQMLQSEKMSSLGQLVAGIAHEINNPINFIHGNVNHVNEYAQNLLELMALYQQTYPEPTPLIAEKVEDIDLEFLTQDLPKLLTSMNIGTERIREIVKSLRLFSRLDEAEVKPVDIHDGINSTLMILQSRLKAKHNAAEIQVIKNYGQLPLVECFAGQLNQVFMNILSNAIDAVEDRIALDPKESGTIHITTEVLDQWVEIRFQDNGVGIPERVRAKIFDPFFTTKPVGKGTGMGMSISYQIITDKHGGKIFCESRPNQGTEFVIQIPIYQFNADQDAM